MEVDLEGRRGEEEREGVGDGRIWSGVIGPLRTLP